MLSMLDRHAVQALLHAGQTPRQIAHQLGMSRRTVQRIALEPPVTTVDDTAARAACGIGRPGVGDATTTRLRGGSRRSRRSRLGKCSGGCTTSARRSPCPRSTGCSARCGPRFPSR